MRKGFLLTLVGLLVVCCLLYGVIIALPRPRHQAVVDEGLAAAEKAFAAAQADANEASTNGFLNPTFLPYWGRKDKESVPDAPIRQVVENWNAQLYPENDENVDPGKLLKEKNPQFLAALTEFEKVAPELEKAMYAPRFVPPESRITLSTLVMNYIALRSAELGITGLGEVRLAQGRPAEAVSALLAPVVLGSHMLNHGSVLTDQLACATVARGSDAYLCLLDPRSTIPAAVWKKASSILATAVPPRDQALLATQMEMAAGNNSFRDAMAGQTDTELGGLSKFPGMVGRERRIYNNTMTDLIAFLKGGSPAILTDLSADGVGSWDYLSGRIGASTQYVPNVVPLVRLVERNRRQLAGLSVLSGVAAYLAETKGLPKDLDEVRGVAEIPDAATLTELGLTYKVGGKQATLTMPLETYPSEVPALDAFGPHPWVKRDEKGIVWTI